MGKKQLPRNKQWGIFLAREGKSWGSSCVSVLLCSPAVVEFIIIVTPSPLHASPPPPSAGSPPFAPEPGDKGGKEPSSNGNQVCVNLARRCPPHNAGRRIAGWCPSWESGCHSGRQCQLRPPQYGAALETCSQPPLPSSSQKGGERTMPS